ncbi:alpha/beta fold hydrolase [Siccirubricoccus sp. G192]|uniref:alpha/beta fold hydrolase n=1 Tax=Siccirubricoccus sp. G192 TaxID=2849651 RepID=UPI001C2CA906|nr:alpha/beta hydrolase [Siccirubricoccus sp. G192]MBV1799575.1 alpha/beta hydrolase [Siccirubricoccus sp. G192]
MVARIDGIGTARATTYGSAGRRVTWRLWGGEDLPLLVLLHGDFGSWTHWIRCVLPLSERFRVIAPDMPGYGDSDMPPEPWGPEDLAVILAAGLGQLLPGPRRYCLAGFSFGGIIAGHLAALDGERVEKLVLLGPGGLGLPRGPLPPLRRLDRGMGAEEAFSIHRHNLAALMLADPARVDALAVHLQLENAHRARVRAGGIPASDTLLRALPRVHARIAGIWGERDAMAQPVHEREEILRRLQSGLDFRIIPGAGHWTPYEAAEAVHAALLELLLVD